MRTARSDYLYFNTESRIMNRFKQKLANFKERLDTMIAASALAQAGEVDLARKMMIEAGQKQSCCGAIDDGRDCFRVLNARCDLVLQQQA